MQTLRDIAQIKQGQKVLINGASGGDGHFAIQRPLNRDRLFFSGMALLILGIVIVGFAPTFYLAPLFPGRPAPAERFFYMKGVIFSAVSAPPLLFLVEPFFDMVTFASLVGLALIWRRDAASHKRLMLLASLAMVDAAAARCPFVSAVHPIWGPVAMVAILVLALAAYDLSTTGRLHPVTLWAGGALILSFPLRFWIGTSKAWQHVAAMAVDWAR